MLDDFSNLSHKEMQAFIDEIKKCKKALPARVNADPEKIENGLAKLVLTVILLCLQVKI
jgi:diadenosine tetraphosphate (Ap4A) HIT family hydrolase